MYIVDEKDREYRFGDSGPKYLMKVYAWTGFQSSLS